MKKLIIIFTPLLCISIILGCAFGSADIMQLIGNDTDTALIIILNLRLPRVIAAVLCGIGLSVSGVLLQCVTGNTLAAPNIIGVNSGAGFCCIVMLTFFPKASVLLQIGAFAGAFITTLVIVGIASHINAFRGTVILAGIAITAVLNACISFLSLLDSDVLTAYNAFSVGGLAGIRMSQLYVPAIIITGCLLCSLILSRRIQLLCLGDAIAASLGVSISKLRIACIILASASAAAVVSFAGLLGFVGLVVPHMARRISGERTSKLLITSSMIGAILVILADLFGRIILAPTEIPVGIIMALIGAPFFFILLFKRRGDNAEM
ncbi:MAG: iron ABC transporter permease [Clostridia bacterium]|nr:iron ABC transporter permease [Clostridia bacterium]